MAKKIKAVESVAEELPAVSDDVSSSGEEISIQSEATPGEMSVPSEDNSARKSSEPQAAPKKRLEPSEGASVQDDEHGELEQKSGPPASDA